MKFERLSENKIRIILTMQDLTEKHIDFHSFMSNSIESQDILIDMLEQAKKETGFDPGDFNLKIEALAMADTSFVFTITKVYPEQENQKGLKKKFTVKRKVLNPLHDTYAVYCFNSFEDFCSLLLFLKKSKICTYISKIASNVLLYSYKDKYYLQLSNINTDIALKYGFYACITEFAKSVTNSRTFTSKLSECGTLVMKHNALKTGLKHFAKM